MAHLALDRPQASIAAHPARLLRRPRPAKQVFGENAQIAWAGLPNTLWLHSFYLLSGLFFKKLRWLSATITLGALATLTTLSIAIGGFLFLDTLKDSDYSIEFVPWAGDALMHGTSILFLLLTVLNYWLSFRIFKRLQVINNRFFNW